MTKSDRKTAKSFPSLFPFGPDLTAQGTSDADIERRGHAERHAINGESLAAEKGIGVATGIDAAGAWFDLIGWIEVSASVVSDGCAARRSRCQSGRAFRHPDQQNER